VTSTTGEGDDAVTTSTCTAVDLTADSYYIYKCSDDGCVTDDLTSITSSDKVAIYKGNTEDENVIVEQVTTGSYYDSSKLLLCESTGECKLATNEGYYVNPDENTKSTKPLIKVSGDTPTFEAIASSKISTDGYYVDGNTYTSDDTSYTYTRLIACSSSTECSYSDSDATVGIYLDASTKKTSGSTTTYSKLIECVNPTGGSLGCSSINLRQGYFIDGKDNTNNKKIIVCSSTSCQPKEASSNYDGYYVDESTKTIETDDENNTTVTKYTKLIHCITSGDSSTCTSAEAPKTGYILNSATKTSNTNGLLYCSATNDCVIDNGTNNGYYLNAANDNSIINCKTTGCVENTATTFVGYYLNEEGKTIEENEATYENIIQCSIDNNELKCSNVSGPNGYYINEGSKNSSNYSKLIFCETTTGDNAKTTCTSIDTVIAGYYIDSSDKDGKKLIECSGSSVKCQSKPVTDVDNGYYINDGDIIICLEENDNKSCKVLEDYEAGFYINSGYDKASKHLIHCIDDSGCITEVALEGYYINESSKVKDSDPVKYSGLIYCEKNSSTKITTCIPKTDTAIPEGNIIDNGTKKDNTSSFLNLIQCSDGSCSTAGPTKIGYYIDGSIGTKIIQCTQVDDTTKVCSSSAHNVQTSKQKHYLDAITNRVITCTSSICFLEDATIKGYFLNSGSTSKPLISCSGENGTPCSEIENPSNLSGIGSVKVDNSNLSICVANSCAGTSDKKTTATESYETIEVEANIFSGVSIAGTISIKIGTDGSIILLEPVTELPTCNNTSGDNSCVTEKPEQYCIDNDKKIYKTTVNISDEGEKSYSCGAATESLIFLDYEFKEMDTPTSNTLNIMAYRCSSDSCELAKGYVSIGSDDNVDIIQCNGWKREGCRVTKKNTTTSCANSDINGKISGNGTKVCFIPSNPISLTENISYVAFQASTTNSFYGQEKNAIVFLEMTNSYILVVNPTGKKQKKIEYDIYIKFYYK